MKADEKTVIIVSHKGEYSQVPINKINWIKDMSKAEDLGKAHNYYLDNNGSIAEIMQGYADQEHQSRVNAISDEMKQAIDNIKSKEKSFLGTKGEDSRQSFKSGLNWSLDSFQIIYNKLLKK